MCAQGYKSVSVKNVVRGDSAARPYCPYCGGKLEVWDKSATEATMVCAMCHKTITAKTRAGKVIEVITPTMGAITVALAIARLFGINNIDDLNDWINQQS
jgi:hypothetical protein